MGFLAGPLLGAAGGSSLAGSLISAGAGLIGSSMASRAADRSADAQVRAAEIAAEAAKFRPYAVTTGFGRSFFDEAAQTAGYELDPELAAFRDFYYQQAREAQQQLAGMSPQEMAAQVLAEQQGLLAPTRRAEDIALRQQQLGRGRIGLGVSPEAVGAGMMGGAVNPEQYAQQLARARADAEMAAAAREYGQAEVDRLIGRAGGLFQTGAGIEQLGMTPLEQGAAIGGRASQAGAQQAQALLSGGSQAANLRLAGGLGAAQAVQRAGQQFGGLFANQPVSTAQPYIPYVGTGMTNANANYLPF